MIVVATTNRQAVTQSLPIAITKNSIPMRITAVKPGMKMPAIEKSNVVPIKFVFLKNSVCLILSAQALLLTTR